MKKILLSVFGILAAISCFSSSASAANQGSQKMYRMYNPNSGEHFYTANLGERDNLVNLGWNYEGIGWVAPQASDQPVYRMYNENASDHHYTLSREEADYLVEQGWKDEGIGWYSSETEELAVYRAYNPNAVSGSHHYTYDKNEINSLVDVGWKDEAIGWYGISEPTYDGESIHSINRLTNRHGRVSNTDILNAAQTGNSSVVGNTANYANLVATLKTEVKTNYGTYYEIAFPDTAIGWVEASAITDVKDYWRYTTGGPYPSLAVPNLNIEVSYNNKRTYLKSGDNVIYTMLSQNVNSKYQALTGNYQINGYRADTFWSLWGGANYAVGWQDALYLFHSVPITSKNGPYDASSGERLGVVGDGVSAGCVILSVEDSKWLYENIPTGTPVNIHW